MSYMSERERFRELLRRAATEDSQRLHPDRARRTRAGLDNIEVETTQ